MEIVASCVTGPWKHATTNRATPGSLKHEEEQKISPIKTNILINCLKFYQTENLEIQIVAIKKIRDIKEHIGHTVIHTRRY